MKVQHIRKLCQLVSIISLPFSLKNDKIYSKKRVEAFITIRLPIMTSLQNLYLKLSLPVLLIFRVSQFIIKLK